MRSDSVLPNIVEFSSNQPSFDSSSLCVGALSVSPFAPLNFVKIPCDYPIFRAGVICKKQLLIETSDSTDEEVDSFAKIDPQFQGFNQCRVLFEQLYNNRVVYVLDCDSEFFLLNDECVTMLTNYTFSNASDSVAPGDVTIADAMSMCSDVSATVAYDLDVDKVQMYLQIWNHTKDFGRILVSQEDDVCFILEVCFR